MQEERDGIQQTLNQQISMYKKMLNEKEVKHKQKLKDIQKGFNQEIQKIIASKEEEAKYASSEKELLQNRINELQNEISEMRDQLDHGGSNYDELTKNHEKLQIHYKNVCERLEESQKRDTQDAKKAKQQYGQLSRKLYNTEVEFKSQLQKIQLQREIREIFRSFIRWSYKKYNKRLHKAMVNYQELKDLSATFEAEANRLKDIISNKEQNFENLNGIINEEKEKYVNLTRASTEEIKNLVNEKKRCKEEIDSLNYQRAQDKQAYRQLPNSADKEIAGREAAISKLNDQLQLSSVSFEREKEQLSYFIDGPHRQNAGDNSQIFAVGEDNKALCGEMRDFKGVLLQSLLQMGSGRTSSSELAGRRTRSESGCTNSATGTNACTE